MYLKLAKTVSHLIVYKRRNMNGFTSHDSFNTLFQPNTVECNKFTYLMNKNLQVQLILK